MTIPTIQVCQDFIQGDDFVIKVSHNPVVDLTDASFELTLKKAEEGDPILYVLYAVPAGADATGGIANIPVPSVKTALVEPGEYFASLKRTLAAGTTKTLIRTGATYSDAIARKVEVYKNLKND